MCMRDMNHCVMGLVAGIIIGGCIVYKSKTVRKMLSIKEEAEKGAMEEISQIVATEANKVRTKLADGIESTGEKLAGAVEPKKTKKQ